MGGTFPVYFTFKIGHWPLRRNASQPLRKSHWSTVPADFIPPSARSHGRPLRISELLGGYSVAPGLFLYCRLLTAANVPNKIMDTTNVEGSGTVLTFVIMASIPVVS